MCRLSTFDILSTEIKIKHALARVYLCHSYICSSFVLAGAHNDAIFHYTIGIWMRRVFALIVDIRCCGTKHSWLVFALIWLRWLMRGIVQRIKLTIVDTNRFLSSRNSGPKPFYFMMESSLRIRWKWFFVSNVESATKCIQIKSIVILMSCKLKNVARMSSVPSVESVNRRLFSIHFDEFHKQNIVFDGAQSQMRRSISPWNSD